MSLFLLSYLVIYGGTHTYLLVRSVRAFGLPAAATCVLTSVALFMISAPILVRVLEHHGREVPARVIAKTGYFWMGFFFLFLSATIFLDLLHGAAALAGWLVRRELWFHDRFVLSLSLLIALSAALYGMWEATRIRVERIELKSPRIPRSLRMVRVVQISDVHLGLMVGKERLQKIVSEVSTLSPDLIVSTGDLVDGQMDGLKGLDEHLLALDAPLGKYAVLGNHEALAGVAPSIDFTKRSGFAVLQEESAAVADWLTVAGVDDPFLVRGRKGATDHLLLERLPRERFTILLKHRPSVETKAAGLFDLQLSGHVHKGQIFPFNLLTHLVYPLKMGLSEVRPGSFVYVSRGTGTWGPPMRVLAPPEITVFDLFPS